MPPATLPTSASQKFTISSLAPQDIWRKPPSHNVFNAPHLTTTIPISSFRLARVSVSGPWTRLYDQGGILLILPGSESRAAAGLASGGENVDKNANANANARWVKMGIEFYHGKPMMSVVAADEWADWSLGPLEGRAGVEGKVTVEVEREREADGSWGSVLRVSVVGEDGVRSPVREVTWAFFGNEEAEMQVGVFAARPTVVEGGEEEELVVEFEGWVLEKREE